MEEISVYFDHLSIQHLKSLECPHSNDTGYEEKGRNGTIFQILQCNVIVTVFYWPKQLKTLLGN